MDPNDKLPSNGGEAQTDSTNAVLIVIEGGEDTTVRKRPANRPLHPPGRQLSMPPPDTNGTSGEKPKS